MKIVFMGTPDFAVPVLRRLVEAGHEIAAVYSRPGRMAGRGRRERASPVQRFAEDRGMETRQPESLGSESACAELQDLSPDAVVTAAYGRFVPAALLSIPSLGCLNVHPSLLPKYRGPSPVVSAILNGDDVTGVTIMKLDEGMDSGPILAQREVPIQVGETGMELTHRLFDAGAALLVEVLPGWASGRIQAAAQDERLATTTTLVKKSDGEIDWSLRAEDIERMVRAYRPWPGAFTHWGCKLVKIVAARALEGTAAHGEVVELDGGRIGIGAGRGMLHVDSLQIEGGREMGAREFLRGREGFAGAILRGRE